MRVRLCLSLLLAGLVLLGAGRSRADEKKQEVKGQRVFTCGHSFHVFVPGNLAEVAKSAGIKDHKMAGLSSIGGSRVIQHWNVEEKKNKAKELLGKGEVDVLTLSPIYLPDEGIDKFVELALEHNKDVRVTVQANWLPWDTYDPKFKRPEKKVDHDAPTVEGLKKMHKPYFDSIDQYVRDLNKKHGKQA